MYLEHFGLRESPFTIAPNPQYLFMSRRHRDALAHLLFGLHSDGGFVLLTGEVGTGKTTLCRRLLEQVPADVNVAFVLNPRVSAPELLAVICDEFHIPYSPDDSSKQLVDLLNSFLLDQHAANRKSVVIIDEAQNLDIDVLEQLRLLTNLETSERKLLQIILLGQPELQTLLNQPDLRQFSQRITARFHLEALDASETADYIAHRLEVAGIRRTIFNRSAVREIFRLSRGIPRVINLICDRSLLGAYAEDQDTVSRAIVSRAAEEVLGQVDRSRGIRPLTAVALVLLSAFLAWAGWYQGQSTHEIGSPPPVDTAKTVEPDETAQSVAAAASIPAVSSAPALPQMNGRRNLEDAYHDLFALWGTAFEARDQPACELARTIGLMCNTRPASLETLVLLNRPAVIYQAGSYLTISHVSDTGVTLIAGSNEYEVPRAVLERQVSGNMYLFWRTPPRYQQSLKIGDKGPAVDWLVIQMALIRGEEPPLGSGYLFDDALAASVRAFQARVGLEPNGIVDVDTWIHLNSVEAINIPLIAAHTG